MSGLIVISQLVMDSILRVAFVALLSGGASTIVPLTVVPASSAILGPSILTAWAVDLVLLGLIVP